MPNEPQRKMANTTLCVMKECGKCGVSTRATWTYKGFFYCYRCYVGQMKKTRDEKRAML